MKKHCFTLDLKNNPILIEEYEKHHQNVWPEVIESIKSSGIINMEIYRIATRLFMIMEVNDNFSFETKAKSDKCNSNVIEWEKLMDEFQQRLPFAKKDEKWVAMNNIFKL